MKNKLNLLLYLIIVSLLSSCKINRETLFLDLAKASYPNTIFNESAYFSNLDSVVLCSDSLNIDLLGDKIYPGNKYIIVYSHNKIIAFSRDGMNSSILANSGRGPGEVIQVLDIKMDKEENHLFCLQNNTNVITVYSLRESRLIHTIQIAKNLTLTSFDFINDSLLICFPLLTSQNNVLAFTQDLSGNLIKELKIEEQIPNGPIYNENPAMYRVNNGFIYMPYPLNTVYFIDSLLECKQDLLKISKNEDKTQFVNYRILFPDRDRLILSATTNVVKNDGAGSLVLFPESEKFYELDLINDKISLVNDSTNQFPNMSFYRPGYLVITPEKQPDAPNTILIGQTKHI